MGQNQWHIIKSTASDKVQTVSMIWYYTRCTDYYGPWEYVNGRLNRFNIPGGFIYGDSVYYNVSDHQGNIRQVWNATTGQTVQDNHFIKIYIIY